MSALRSRVGRRVLVNQSYRMQRITGQQRYATEISARLIAGGGFVGIAPKGFFAASALRVWAWLQFLLPIASWRSRLLSMTSRAPLFHPRQVIVVHDLFVITNPEWFSRKYVLSHAPLLRAQLRRAAAVVAVSQPVADQVAELFHGPVVVAPNAPSDVFSHPALDSDAEVLSSRGLRAGRYLLAVGSMDPRKNLPKLAAAYGRLSAEQRAATPLVIVGGGNAIFRDQSLDWPEGTVSAGFVSDEELRALYAGAGAIVFVSLAEGFGLPIVEAAAAGATRFIISDIPVFRWICGDQATYVDPTSIDSIAAALGSIDVDEVGSGLQLDRFTWDDSARVIRQLLNPEPETRSTVPDTSYVRAPAPGRTLSAAVALASAGRPELLSDVIRNLADQTLDSFGAVLSVPDETSLPEPAEYEGSWNVVAGSKGLAVQRNAALDALDGTDIVFFFDDDAVVREDYLSVVMDFFAEHPEVMGVTGRVLLDGAVKGEISSERAAQALADSSKIAATGRWRTTQELYGCNFAVRASATSGLRFDGRLPLYSWLEDHDFARRLQRIGPLARVDDAVIVHRAASSGGRQAHTRLGYSQMMNPIYIWRKGSFPAWLAVREIFRPTAKNVALSLIGPQSSWRRERLRGNVLALSDALRGRITPERITEL